MLLLYLADGWVYDKSYRFLITHLPECGIIRLKLYEGAKLLHDSGDIVDNGPESLRGGRLGVYCDSQDNVQWSALRYRWPGTTLSQLQNFAFSGASRASRLIFAT